MPHAPGATLAHLAACISVAEALREQGHEPVFAYGGTRPELLDGAGFKSRRVVEVNGAMSEDWFESDEHLDRVLSSQMAAIEDASPDVCITSAGAGRLAVAVAGARHLALMHGLGNSPAGRRGRRHTTILSDLRRPARALKDLWLQVAPRRRHESGAIWARGWLRHTGAELDVETVATGRADAVACTTTPLLDPADRMPARWRYVGPLSFSPAATPGPAAGGGDARGAGLSDDSHAAPRAYISQGSTGEAGLLRRSVAELARAGFSVVVSTGGLCDGADLRGIGDRIEAAELHDSRAELAAADVAVIGGGHMTATEALVAGTPTVVVPRTPGQALAAKRAERLGTGVGLWPRVPRGSIARASLRISSSERYRARATEVAACLRGWDGPRNAAAMATRLAGRSS